MVMVHCGEDPWSEDPARELNNQISELQARVAFPQHWSSGEHEQHIEKLRQLTYEKSRLMIDQAPLLWSELITEELSYKSVGAWLANEPQQLYYQFTASKDGSQGESIVMRSFHWRPPDDPIPQGSQLMTRQEALEKWNALKSMGWRRCAGPLR